MEYHSYLHSILDLEAVMGVDRKEVERRLLQFKATARKAGVKLTHQRLEIFREVASSIEHPAVETVFRAVQARMPTVSLDTVYRTLWRLEELGLITTLGPRRGAVRLDANLQPHHHFICMHCGLTRDFEDPRFDALRVPDGAKTFGDIVGTRVELRGVCRDCSRRAAVRGRRGSTRTPRRRDG
jgi:Fur family transcriptional regulator, peroxide stress response regulator